YLIETGGARPVYVVHPDANRVLAAVGPATDDSLMASAPVPTAGWTLRVVLPHGAAYGPLDHARRTLLAQMGVLGLIFGALVWAGTFFMLRPFGRLHRAIRMLRQSPDSAVTLDVHARDERGDLAREFDALITELRNKRSEMAAVMDASPLGLFRCDADGLMVYVNDAYLTIHGLVRSESDRGWLYLLPEAVQDDVWADWQQRVRDDKPFHVTRWLRRREGNDVRISLQMRPVMVDGKVSGQVGTVADITQRMRAEQALRTLTAIFESTTDFVVQLDNEGKLTYMNPAARSVTGVPLDASVSHLTMSDFNPPHTLRRLMSEVVPTAVAKGVWVGESEIWDAHKNVFPVSHMVIAHRDKRGKVERFSAIMRDISLAKSTELALSESEARLRTMADALPMRVAYIDADGRYLFANRAYEGFFGLSRGQIEGRTVREVLGAERYAAIETQIAAVQSGRKVTFENSVITPDDSMYYQSNYIPQRSVDGESVIGFHAVTIDITEQKREEQRLVQMASQDPLTGLGNRIAFERRLADAMAHCQQHRAIMALMYIDLDRFKQVNDRFGHPCGDALLKAVAERLSGATRSTDFVSRLGGDEFTVILQMLRESEDATHVAEKIIAAMKEPFRLGKLTLDISASVGVACYGGAPATPDQLTRRADEMLYQAKAAGRDNYQVALVSDGLEIGG
ncbi:MAG: diguanylate cyclase, partial [Gammaproteobacteria bacterium]|nr:diguanylate cyclase [Gammaproteobacteria bacterium]